MFSVGVYVFIIYYVLIVSQVALEEDTGDEEREAVNSTGVLSAQMDLNQSTL